MAFQYFGVTSVDAGHQYWIVEDRKRASRKAQGIQAGNNYSLHAPCSDCVRKDRDRGVYRIRKLQFNIWLGGTFSINQDRKLLQKITNLRQNTIIQKISNTWVCAKFILVLWLVLHALDDLILTWDTMETGARYFIYNEILVSVLAVICIGSRRKTIGAGRT